MAKKMIANEYWKGKDTENIEGTVYLSQQLYDAVGDFPGVTVGAHLREVFSEVYGANYTEIWVMNERSDCPVLETQEVNCGLNDISDSDGDDDDGDGIVDEGDDDEVTSPHTDFADYINNDAPREASHFNLCLTDHRHVPHVVGCGGGNIAVAEGGRDIDEDIDLPYAERFRPNNEGAQAIHTAIHEVGHCLGMQHRVGTREVRTPDQINGWIDGSVDEPKYCLSPLAPGQNQDTVCDGANNEPNDYDYEVYIDIWFSGCARRNDDL